MVLSNGDIIKKIESLRLQWKLVDNYIERQIEFKNFDAAFHFMKSVAEICKEHNHHPYWINNFKLVIIRLHTVDLGGVTIKDLNLAMEIDKLKI